ncbi:serine/threonine deaminase, partial [Thalassiosira pseudonana CCMP1335]
FLTTPLIHSIPLSNLCAPHQVYLKLDLLQPSGSFKDRGMAHLCMTLKKVHTANRKQKQQLSPGGQDDGSGNTMKLISSSGGNAGLAVTTVARNIPDMEVSVIVPETTKPLVIEKLRSLGADVTVHGANWNLADDLARKLVKEHRDQDGDSALSGGAEYVSPYDNPLLWTGHSTVVDEIITQLIDTKHDVKVGAILASVGGGGLLCGILEGLERNYFGGSSVRSNVISGTKVVACETEGAASFAASKKGTTMVRLEGINSVATSLGALEVTPAVIHRSRRHQERGQIGGSGEDVLSYVCTDAEAVNACVQFSSHHRMLVEPACGAALAPLYSDRLRTKLLEELKSKGEESSAIVVEVCGGSGVNLDLLEGWKKQF